MPSSLQTPFFISQEYPAGQQWMESLQQTAFSTGQQPNVLLFNWQQVVASGQTALPLGHWLLLAQTRITEQLISDNTLMCHFICPKKIENIYIIINDKDKDNNDNNKL